MRGKKAYLIEYLQTHTAFRDKYLEMIRTFISAANDRSVLDKESLKAIEAEDAVVEPQAPAVPTTPVIPEGMKVDENTGEVLEDNTAPVASTRQLLLEDLK